ncbi:MAG: hypothetical protein H7320_18350 [Ferruginibacter sp.]|nr:hypothetical protein [Ferruginibacter sp.]
MKPYYLLKTKNLRCMLLLLFITTMVNAQQIPKPKLTVTGTAGIWYEGYGLGLNTHSTPTIYTQRRPWNLVRFSFQPVVNKQ